MNKKIYITDASQIETISCDRREQETAINWLRDDDIVEICTSDLTMVTKLARMVAKDPDNYKCFYYECNRDSETGKLGNYFFEVPKKLLSFRTGGEGKTKKNLTADERKAIAERFKKGRENRNDSSI